MSGSSTIPAYTGGSRQAAQKRGGLGSIVLIAVLGVLAIGVFAVVLGVTGSNDFVDNLREKIPGLEPSENDGWTSLDDPAGGFIAQMPEDRQKKFMAFAPAANGRLDQWSAVIGTETDLTISYGKVTKPAGQSDKAALASFADTWAVSLNGKLDDTAETSFRGYEAVDVAVRDLSFEGESASARALMVMKGDTLYVIQSLSVYPDHPQFVRLVNDFQFTA
jgi:hypothetical protein